MIRIIQTEEKRKNFLFGELLDVQDDGKDTKKDNEEKESNELLSSTKKIEPPTKLKKSKSSSSISIGKSELKKGWFPIKKVKLLSLEEFQKAKDKEAANKDKPSRNPVKRFSSKLVHRKDDSKSPKKKSTVLKKDEKKGIVSSILLVQIIWFLMYSRWWIRENTSKSSIKSTATTSSTSSWNKLDFIFQSSTSSPNHTY